MDHDTSQWDIVKATQYGIFDRCKVNFENSKKFEIVPKKIRKSSRAKGSTCESQMTRTLRYCTGRR